MALHRVEALRRVFAADLGGVTPGERVPLSKDARKHLGVLRIGEGSKLGLFDGRGRLVQGRYEGGVVVAEAIEEAPALRPKLVLVMALPKGSKADEIVRHATELGVAEIRFVSSDHAVPKLEGGRAEKKRERWEKIAQEAARQSERLYVPQVLPLAPLGQAMEAAGEGERWVCWARGGEAPSVVPGAEERWVAVGPEGGFSEAELRAFDAQGWRRVRLGPTVLRAETASLAALVFAGADLREHRGG